MLKRLGPYFKDETVVANEGMAAYWIRVGAAEEVKDEDFDPKARKKELMKLNRDEIDAIGKPHKLDPADYSTKGKMSDAIVKAETPK